VRENTLNGVPWTPGEPNLPSHCPCRASLLSHYPTSTAGHPARSPSTSPFPNLINEAALKALLHSDPKPSSRSSRRSSAGGYTDQRRAGAAAYGGNQPFQEKREGSWETSLPLPFPKSNTPVGKTSERVTPFRTACSFYRSPREEPAIRTPPCTSRYH